MLISLGVLLMFLAGVLVDWSITGALSVWDWAALIALGVLLLITLALRPWRGKRVSPEQVRWVEPCQYCSDRPAWCRGCSQCDGLGYIAQK